MILFLELFDKILKEIAFIETKVRAMEQMVYNKGNMQKNKKPTFPKSFFWGAAVSAHQVEGGNYNQWSVWELENAKVLATQAPHR